MTKSTNWKEQFISSRGFFLATRAGSPILWRIAHWTLSLLTPDSPGTFSLSSLTAWGCWGASSWRQQSSFWSASCRHQHQTSSSSGQPWEKSRPSLQMPWPRPPSPSESSQEYQSTDESQVVCVSLLSSGTTRTFESREMRGFSLGVSCWQWLNISKSRLYIDISCSGYCLPPTGHHQPITTVGRRCRVAILWTGRAQNSWVPVNESAELGYFYSQLQASITRLNIVRRVFLKYIW